LSGDKTIPKVIEYIPLVIKKDLIRSEDDLHQLIQMESQGKAVIMEDIFTIPVAMRVFRVLLQNTLEIIFQTDYNNKILLFSNANYPIIRPPEFITELVYKEGIKNDHGRSITINEINLEDYWSKLSKVDEVRDIRDFLSKIHSRLKKSDTTFLTGNVPTIAFLIVQNLLFGHTNQLYYQNPVDKQLDKIY